MPRNHNRQQYLLNVAPPSSETGAASARAYVFLGLPAGTYRIEVINPRGRQKHALRSAGYSEHRTPRVEYWSLLVEHRPAAVQELRWLNQQGIAGILPEEPAPELAAHAQENGNAALNAVHIYTTGDPHDAKT